jgi:hypothetical protein
MATADPAPLIRVLTALAAQVHGVVRSTADVDVTVRLGGATIVQLLSALRGRDFAEVFADEEFRAASRVIPVRHAATGVAVDIILAGPAVGGIGLEDQGLSSRRS